MDATNNIHGQRRENFCLMAASLCFIKRMLPHCLPLHFQAILIAGPIYKTWAKTSNSIHSCTSLNDEAAATCYSTPRYQAIAYLLKIPTRPHRLLKYGICDPLPRLFPPQPRNLRRLSPFWHPYHSTGPIA